MCKIMILSAGQWLYTRCNEIFSSQIVNRSLQSRERNLDEVGLVLLRPICQIL